MKLAVLISKPSSRLVMGIPRSWRMKILMWQRYKLHVRYRKVYHGPRLLQSLYVSQVLSDAQRSFLTKTLQFLGLAPVGPISGGQLMAGAILVQIGSALGNLTDIGWLISGWAIASSVSFCVAGRLSDIFGRRYIILFGEFVAVIGSVSCHRNFEAGG